MNDSYLISGASLSTDHSNDPSLRIDKLNVQTNITGFLPSFLNSYEVSPLTLKNGAFTS